MKKIILLCAALFLVTSGFSCFAYEKTSIIKTENGRVQGIVINEMNAYLGIPYALPPINELRWQPPIPFGHWDGVRNTINYGNSCPQNTDYDIFSKAGGHEDCLTLNVFTPKKSYTNENLPVLVWIHAGGLSVGQGADYDPQLLVAQNAIVVTINYRLGLLGFFAHPNIIKNQDVSINYGLMDQNLALNWVKQNIAFFGGNPNNITLSGESAGGGSVLAQIISPFSKDKFQQAIAMSGSAIINNSLFGGSISRAEAENTAKAFSDKVNCSNQYDVSFCLRNLPIDIILAEQPKYFIKHIVVDGTFIPMHPYKAFESGNFNKVLLVNGTNHDEANSIVGIVENVTRSIMTAEDYMHRLENIKDKEFAQKIYQEYPLKDYNTPSEAYAAVLTSYAFTCPALRLNTLFSRYSSIYAYTFSDQTAPNFFNPTSFPLKASHASELPYLFFEFRGSLDNPNIPKLNLMQKKLSDEMTKIWVNTKNISNYFKWEPFNPQKENYLVFVLPSPIVKNGYSEIKKHCDFWSNSGIYD